MSKFWNQTNQQTNAYLQEEWRVIYSLQNHNTRKDRAAELPIKSFHNFNGVPSSGNIVKSQFFQIAYVIQGNSDKLLRKRKCLFFFFTPATELPRTVSLQELVSDRESTFCLKPKRERTPRDGKQVRLVFFFPLDQAFLELSENPLAEPVENESFGLRECQRAESESSTSATYPKKVIPRDKHKGSQIRQIPNNSLKIPKKTCETKKIVKDLN